MPLRRAAAPAGVRVRVRVKVSPCRGDHPRSPEGTRGGTLSPAVQFLLHHRPHKRVRHRVDQVSQARQAVRVLAREEVLPRRDDLARLCVEALEFVDDRREADRAGFVLFGPQHLARLLVQALPERPLSKAQCGVQADVRECDRQCPRGEDGTSLQLHERRGLRRELHLCCWRRPALRRRAHGVQADAGRARRVGATARCPKLGREQRGGGHEHQREERHSLFVARIATAIREGRPT
mmetsp:Transcript_49367/g.164788  ORF Transcript_49367/g.164788 Transcript_49367/m.164788 type:complete len:237 (+) Transcript_49367:1316-2026(+)